MLQFLCCLRGQRKAINTWPTSQEIVFSCSVVILNNTAIRSRNFMLCIHFYYTHFHHSRKATPLARLNTTAPPRPAAILPPLFSRLNQDIRWNVPAATDNRLLYQKPVVDESKHIVVVPPVANCVTVVYTHACTRRYCVRSFGYTRRDKRRDALTASIFAQDIAR